MSDAVTFTPLRVPPDAEAVYEPDAADFRASVEVRNAFGAAVHGPLFSAVAPAQTLPYWRDQTDVQLSGWLLRHDGAVAGRVMLDLPNEEGSLRAMLRVEVLPDFWHTDLQRRGLAFGEEQARLAGRTVVQIETTHPADAPATLSASTGWGAVPDDHQSRPMRERGYTLEQVFRLSALDVPAARERLDGLIAQARAVATGYRYVSWLLPTPEAWLDDVAWMKSRMSTDAPSGEQEVDEEVWDADRVRRHDRTVIDTGCVQLVGAAQHLASGRLVAFTELSTFGRPGDPGEQNDTLVLREHRGHRLGMLVKAETLRRAEELLPGFTVITTGNAEENRPMLSINEQLGFVATHYSAEWQKVLA